MKDQKKRPRGCVLKQCYDCLKVKPLANFQMLVRVSKRCRKCRRTASAEAEQRNRDRSRAYFRNNRDAALFRVRTRYREDPRNGLLVSARGRAKQRGRSFSIIKGDLHVPKACPLLGIPIIAGSRSDNSPTIDRIDPRFGYILGNVWIVSRKANTIKSDATIEEVDILLRNWKAAVRH